MRSFKAGQRGSFLAGVLVFAAGLAAALPATAQTLNETLIQTYQSNPTLRAARAQLRATNERVPQALSNWRPEVSLEGFGGTAYDDRYEPTDQDQSRTPAGGDLVVRQPIYRGGRTVAGTDRAENEVLAEHLQTKFDVTWEFFDHPTGL